MPPIRARRRPTRRSRRNKVEDPNKIRTLPSNSYQTTIQKALGFSRSQVVKLRYAQQVTLSPNTSADANIVYAANSPYAPNVTKSAGVAASTDHQPKGWDQWAAIYNEYIVISSTCTVSISPPNSTTPSTAGGLIYILLSDQGTAYASPTSMLEDGKASWKQFNPNTSSSSVVVRKSFNAKSFWRLKDIEDNVKDFGALITSTPSERSYFHVGFFCNDSSVTTTTGPYAWVIIDFVVLLTGPQDLGQS